MPYPYTLNQLEEGFYAHSYGAFASNPYGSIAGPSSIRQPQRGYFHEPYDCSATLYHPNWASGLEDSPLGAPRTPPETYPPAFVDTWTQPQYNYDLNALPYPAESGHHAIEPHQQYLTHVSNSQHVGPSLAGNAVEFNKPARPIQSSGNCSPRIHHPQPIRPIPIISLSDLSATEASESKLQQGASPTPLLYRGVSPSLLVQHSKHALRGDTSRRRTSNETNYSSGLPPQPCVPWPLL